ncbi:MAG: potassium-transporting ATPase subunit KdpC [Solirubrobacteraceae bacterium]|nr:potassium-transporting ATPase subunit KdpC [Solirubrobacteraceae bacterium]
MRKDLIASAVAVVLFTVICGLIYPLAVTGISQVVMPGKANGSIVQRDGKDVGSELIGQDFGGKPQYFQSRPSATGYSASATYFNNLGPNQQDLADQLTEAATAYRKREDVPVGEIPPDAVTTSASGIDPHISPENAEIQARRVARERGLTLDRVNDLIDEHTDGRAFGFMGEPGVNVLQLNLALDEETR